MYGHEYDALDFAESCEYEIENRQTTPSPMPWKYLEQTGFVVDANGVYIAQTWNKKEEDFPNAIANGNAITNLTAENAKLREQLAEAVTALQAVTNEMETDVYSGFDPERWGERMDAISAARKVLAAWNKPEPC